MGVMEIAAELYRNPELLEVMKLARELNGQDMHNVIAYLKNTRKVRDDERSSEAVGRRVS